jgi:Family of unknown function (DUF6082)
MRSRKHPLNHRSVFVISSTMLTVALLATVMLSPLALGRFGTLTRMNWSRLSSIGQAYGAVSALLTALALIGVAASLLFQARQVWIAREQAMRTFHHELVRMALDNPIYMSAMANPLNSELPSEQGTDGRIDYYIHLWISFWQTFYIMGVMPESQLRSVCERELFRGRPGREYWERAREIRPSYSEDRRIRHFDRIVEEEYRKAIISQPAVEPPVPRASEKGLGRGKYFVPKTIGALLMATAIGAVVDHAIKRRA